MEIEVLATAQHRIDVGIAPRAEQIMTAAAHLVDAVVGERVANDGAQRSEIRQRRPKPVADGDVRGMQLAGACGPETFSWVVQIPEVEIADLRAVWRGESKYLS